MNMRNVKFPERVRIAVPPGVGDTYWCLTKLKAFREHYGIRHVTLCVKKAALTRALEWPAMTDLVDATEEFAFETDPVLDRFGFSMGIRGVDCAMWPNAIIDRGHHLNDWMPGFALDQAFEIRTADTDWGKLSPLVIYASSHDVNAVWLPGRGPDFWSELIGAANDLTGEPPVLIGKAWDKTFRAKINAPFIDLLGETSLPEVAGILKGARAVVGVICGMTILANHFRTPTVALHPDKFLPGFLTSWITADMPYQAIAARRIPDPAEIIARALALQRPARQPVAGFA